MQISVRLAVLSDIDALTPLFDSYRRFYGCESNPDGARAFLTARCNQGESTLFIAEQQDAGIGFAQLYPSFSSARLARTFILNDLFVHDNYRRMGVGKKLITAAVDFARSRGAARVTLSTGINNLPAQTLYQSCGWKCDDEFLVYHYQI